MPGFGGYFKGEKKKSKKDKTGTGISSNAPTYVMPEIISKKKNEYK